MLLRFDNARTKDARYFYTDLSLYFQAMASITRMALRSFSTSTTANQLVRPSVPVYGVDGRYASALFSAASKSKQLDSVEKDIKLVGELLEKNKQTAGK